MIPLVPFRCAIPVVALLSSLLAGCASSSPARFYSLNSQRSPETSSAKITADHTVIVGIGPVTVPDYVDRPQIVTRTGQNELTMSEFDRWAGSLKSDISRVLVEDLSGMMAMDGFNVVPWKRGIPVTARAALDITRLDINSGVNILLKAQWAIYAKNGETGPIMHESTLTEPINGNDYGSAVAALSRAIGNLSRDIATALKSVAVQQPDDGNK